MIYQPTTSRLQKVSVQDAKSQAGHGCRGSARCEVASGRRRRCRTGACAGTSSRAGLHEIIMASPSRIPIPSTLEDGDSAGASRTFIYWYRRENTHAPDCYEVTAVPRAMFTYMHFGGTAVCEGHCLGASNNMCWCRRQQSTSLHCCTVLAPRKYHEIIHQSTSMNLCAPGGQGADSQILHVDQSGPGRRQRAREVSVCTQISVQEGQWEGHSSAGSSSKLTVCTRSKLPLFRK